MPQGKLEIGRIVDGKALILGQRNGDGPCSILRHIVHGDGKRGEIRELSLDIGL